MLKHLLHLLSSVLLLLALAPPVIAQKVHVLAVGDLSPAAGWGKYSMSVRMDLIEIMVLFSNNIPPAQLNFRQLQIEEDEYSDPQWILKELQELRPAPGDTVVFYFSGHGAADDQGHYLALARGKLYRSQLLKTLTATQARLTVLLTDCCNARSDGMVFAAPFVETEEPRQVSPLLQSLLLEPAGVVDINSSSPGESAFFRPIDEEGGGLSGSIFTGELGAWVLAHRRERRTWDELVRAVSLQVHTAFHTHYPKGAQTAKGQPLQQQQTVYPIVYPGMPENKGPRTGLVLRNFSGTGVVIVRVAEGSPATQVYDVNSRTFRSLTAQQVVVAVNGQRVSRADELAQLIQQSPQIIRFSIRDVSGQQFDVLMRMKY